MQAALKWRPLSATSNRSTRGAHVPLAGATTVSDRSAATSLLEVSFATWSTFFDCNLLLPRIVVQERVLPDKCFLKRKANAHIKITGRMACQIHAFVLCSHCLCKVCTLVHTQMLRDTNTSCPKKSCATALSFSCIDRWRPSPRWSPRWVRMIALAAAATTCRVAPRSKTVHDGLHSGRLIDSSGHERTGWRCKNTGNRPRT